MQNTTNGMVAGDKTVEFESKYVTLTQIIDC